MRSERRPRRRDGADEILFCRARLRRDAASPCGVDMSRQTAGKAASWGRARRAFSLGALGTLLAACSSVGGGPVRTPEPSSYQDVPVSLDGSLATAEGTWAVIKMGHLDQFANTFWQLLVLHRGDTRWSLVTPPGFADNGGLVANSVDGKSLVTGSKQTSWTTSPRSLSPPTGKELGPGVARTGPRQCPRCPRRLDQRRDPGAGGWEARRQSSRAVATCRNGNHWFRRSRSRPRRRVNNVISFSSYKGYHGLFFIIE